jgi:hypothetical protein
VSKLQHPGSAADGLVHDRASETDAACPLYSPATDDVPMLIYFLSTSMCRCTKTTTSVARPGTLNAEETSASCYNGAGNSARLSSQTSVRLMLFSAFTGSRPAALLGDDSSSPNDSQEVSADDLSENTLTDDSDGETLVGSEPGSKARTTRLGTICYGDI